SDVCSSDLSKTSLALPSNSLDCSSLLSAPPRARSRGAASCLAKASPSQCVSTNTSSDATSARPTRTVICMIFIPELLVIGQWSLVNGYGGFATNDPCQ